MTSSGYQNQTASVPVGSGTANVPLSVNLNTLVSNTAYDYRVVSVNGAGTTYGQDQQFNTGLGPIDYWKQNCFTAQQLGNSSASGDAASPAGDGVPNLMKYALGMNPNVNSRVGLPVYGTTSTSGTAYWTFTYSKVDSVSDITFHPEWSNDLSSWSSTGLIEQVLSDNGTVQQVQDSIPAGAAKSLFFRLRVSRP